MGKRKSSKALVATSFDMFEAWYSSDPEATDRSMHKMFSLLKEYNPDEYLTRLLKATKVLTARISSGKH